LCSETLKDDSGLESNPEIAIMGILNKRSISINGRKTGINVENPFWEALKSIAKDRRQTLTKVVEEIDAGRTEKNLSSAIRVFVLAYFRERADPR
jgi:predicted DNA-binding ribbon-helix-helix protein